MAQLRRATSEPSVRCTSWLCTVMTTRCWILQVITWLTSVISLDFRLKLPIDKGEATSMLLLQLCKSGVWSGPCDLTPQLPILGEKVLLVMIATRLGKILLCLACAQCLWSEKCSHMCYGPSSGSIIIGLSSFVITGYKMIDASFIQQMSVLKSLRNLLTFLESSQQPHDDYRELVELMILSLCDISLFGYDLSPKSYAQSPSCCTV